jgi:hypothetical protein
MQKHIHALFIIYTIFLIGDVDNLDADLGI